MQPDFELDLTDLRLVGHSNGGQGAWHLAARYPDRIVGGEHLRSPACDCNTAEEQS